MKIQIEEADLRSVLEALHKGKVACEWGQAHDHVQQIVQAMNAIRSALAEQPAQQQEPVALETVYETIIHWDEGGGKRSRRELARRIVDLYTSPPASKPWVGLTDVQIGQVLDDPNIAEAHQGHWRVLPFAFARAIEAKLKEKNA